MEKGAKIAIGVLATLAVGGLVTWLIVRNRNPKEDQEWEDADVEGKGKESTSLTPEQKKQQSDQKKKNNFTSVKNYFGRDATDYQNRIVFKANALTLEKKLGWVKSVRQDNGEYKMMRTKSLGLGDSEISVVYWEDGQFTVKIGSTKAAIQGYYYNGGRIIKVTKGKGMFASKAGIREVADERLLAIGRIFSR